MYAATAQAPRGHGTGTSGVSAKPTQAEAPQIYGPLDGQKVCHEEKSADRNAI